MAYNPANGTNVWRANFAAVRSTPDTNFWTVPYGAGSGTSATQTGGNLVLTAGVGANQEFIIRSKQSWQSYYLIARFNAMLSQRIVNNNFFVELVDVIGDGLAFTINSATSVTVTIPSNPFTSENVGQSMFLGGISGGLATIPGRYAIASVSGNNVTFTVAGWPASGSGTLSLFGWNYQQVLYDSTTATSFKYDAQRKGFNSGYSAASCNTTASPGHVVQVYQDENISVLSEGLAASATTTMLTQRASRLLNMPTNEFPMYLQIRTANGSTAPASSTTMTIGFVAVEDSAPAPVIVEGGTFGAVSSAVGVNIMNSPSINVNQLANVAALADVTANPTVSTAGAANLVFNGASWDRRRANVNLTVGDTGAKTATFNGALFSNFNGPGGLIACIVSAVSGTTPTMTLQLQWSPDGGTTWLNYGPPTAALTAAGTAVIGCFPAQWGDQSTATLAAMTSGAAVSKFISAPLPRTCRIVYTIGGTTPSFTIANTYFSSIGT